MHVTLTALRLSNPIDLEIYPIEGVQFILRTFQQTVFKPNKPYSYIHKIF